MTDERAYQQQAEEIEAYIFDTMSLEQRKTFERRLADEPALAEQYADHLFVHENRLTPAETDVMHKVQSAASAWETKGKRRFTIARRIMGLAAAVLVLAACWFVFNPSQNQTEQLAFVPYDMVLNSRAKADTSLRSTLLTAAIHAYEKEDYHEAANSFAKLHASEPSNRLLYFYQGVSALGAKQYKKASTIFEELLDQEDHLLTEQARFYLALTYSLSQEHNKADELFKQIKPGEFNPLKN